MPEEAINAEAPEIKSGTPPETKAAPTTEAPAEGSQTESPDNIDWKQRYEDLRPEADRRESLLADIEGRNGPERQAQALAEHARIELEAEEAEEVADDEFDLGPDPNERLDALERERAEETETREAEQFDQLERQYIEKTVEGLEDKEGLKLSDRQYEFIVNDALANRDPHDGKPGLEGSFAAWKAERQAAGEGILKGKDQTVLAPVGTEGEPKIDMRDKEARQKLGQEVFETHKRATQ
jgi:hypothetical protein